MTPQEIKAEVESGPLAASLAADWAAGRTGAVAAALNAKSYTLAWGVPWRVLANWAAGNGVRALLQAGADNTTATPEAIGIRAICLAVLDNLRGSLGTTMLDLTSPATDPMLDALVAAGILTAGQQAELVALGTVPASRVEVIAGAIGAAVTIPEVDAARAL